MQDPSLLPGGKCDIIVCGDRMKNKLRTIIALVMNLLVAVVTADIVVSYFFEQPSLLMKHGYETFRFFTTDSNILAAIACLITAFFEIQMLLGKRESLPRAAVLLKYVAAVSVMLTFLTVMLFLAPLYGVGLIAGTYFHVHVAAPLMVLLSFSLLEATLRLRFREMLLGLIPMAVYGAVYLTAVVIVGEENGGWPDFYQFNQGGRWWITIPVMLAGTFVICLLTALLNNRCLKRLRNNRGPAD